MLLFDNLKFLNRLSYLIILVSIFMLLFVYYRSTVVNLFYINNVTIQGNIKNIDIEEISNVAKKNIHGSLTDIDIYALQKIFHNLPWVKSVIISKSFPHGINIYVKEYIAYAKMNNNSYVTLDGHKFYSKYNNENIPLFYGSDEEIINIISFNTIINNVLSKYAVKVIELSYNDNGIIKFTLSNKVNVEVCEVPITDKIKLLSKFWNKIYSINKNLKYINLCYKSAIAIDKEVIEGENKITKKLIKYGRYNA